MSSSLLSFLLTITTLPLIYLFFFFNDTATTEIYTLSLHDALPISRASKVGFKIEMEKLPLTRGAKINDAISEGEEDRKSTRLNSSHGYISYAVFCLKKKKKKSQ